MLCTFTVHRHRNQATQRCARLIVLSGLVSPHVVGKVKPNYGTKSPLSLPGLVGLRACCILYIPTMHQGSWDTTYEAGSAGECAKLGLAIIGYTECRCVNDDTYGDLTEA